MLSAPPPLFSGFPKQLWQRRDNLSRNLFEPTDNSEPNCLFTNLNLSNLQFSTSLWEFNWDPLCWFLASGAKIVMAICLPRDYAGGVGNQPGHEGHDGDDVDHDVDDVGGADGDDHDHDHGGSGDPPSYPRVWAGGPETQIVH